MKLTSGLATITALASAADAHRYTTAFQGSSPYYNAAVSNTRAPSALEMRRCGPSRRMMGRSCAPSPRSFFSDLEQMDRLMERQFNDFFDSPMVMRPTTPMVMRPTTPFQSPFSRGRDLMVPDRAVMRRPYRYRIEEDDDKFTLTIDLPGVKASDMKVSLENDGRVLRISGMRTTQTGEMSYESKFDKTFVVDKSVDVEQIQANLAEGVMTIDAPKKPKEEPKTVEIPIQVSESTTDEIKVDKVEEAEETAEKIEMNVEDTNQSKSEEDDTLDLDKNAVEEAPKETAKAEDVPDATVEEEKKKDDLMDDREINI